MLKNAAELVVIIGPTASGKSSAAIELAQHSNGVIVSADSRQVYTEMNIGTAKVQFDNGNGDREDGCRKQTPHDILVPDLVTGIEHFLINIRQPDEELSLAEWQAAAYDVIDATIKRGKAPILTGGTMLYVDSIVHGYDIPAVPSDEQWRARLAKQGTEKLYSDLIRLDPKAADFVSPQNSRRIIRALEVIKATGRPFSALRRKQACRYKVRMYGLWPSWDNLQKRIVRRVEQMLEEGLMQEKELLIERYGADCPLLKTINYQQAPNQEEMVRANLKYARRQMSWWRGRDEITWFGDIKTLLKKSTIA